MSASALRLSRSKSNHTAKEPLKNALGQDALERCDDALPEHPDRVPHFRVRIVQYALDKASYEFRRWRNRFIFVPPAHEMVKRRTVDARLRGCGDPALCFDLRSEIAWLDQYCADAPWERLESQTFTYALQGELARAVEPSEG